MNKVFQRVVAAHFFMGKKCCHHHFPSIFIPKRIKKGLYFGYTFLLAQHIHRMRMLSFFVQSLLLIPSLQLVGRRSARHPQPFRIGQTCNGTVFFQISLQQRPTLLLATLFHRRQEAELGTELVRYVGEVTGAVRPIVPLGRGLSKLQATLLEHLPGKLMSRDNLLSTETDYVCGCPFPAVFGIASAALEAIAPQYLAPAAQRSAFDRFRATGGR